LLAQRPSPVADINGSRASGNASILESFRNFAGNLTDLG